MASWKRPACDHCGGKSTATYLTGFGYRRFTCAECMPFWAKAEVEA